MCTSFSNVRFFSRADIQLLVSGYSRDGIHLWGQISLYIQVLGLASMNDPSIVVVAWELSELIACVVCVVDPCSAAPWYLRMVLTPDFIFLGLHWAGSNTPVTLDAYYHYLVANIRERPLAMGAIARQPLDFDQEWLTLLQIFDAHLGGKAGNIGHLPPSLPANIPPAIFPSAPSYTPLAITIAGPEMDLPEMDLPDAPPPVLVPIYASPVINAGGIAGGVGKDLGGVVGGVLGGGGSGGSGATQIVTRDGRVITPQWTASFPPLPGGAQR